MNEIVIFADGACSGNPGPGGWGAVLATQGSVIEFGGGAPHTTNNQMELEAAIQALGYCRKLPPLPIRFHTDSSYVIQGITGWVFGWQKKGWMKSDGTPVANREHWQRLVDAARGLPLTWQHVDGHAGVPGNERADEIAVAYSKKQTPQLYKGPQASYPVDLSVSAASPQGLASKPGKRKAPKEGFYISVVGGELKRHETWKDCEARTKGVPGAKFKKVADESELDATLRAWRLK